MKKIAVCILVISLLIACKGKSNLSEKDSLVMNSTESKQLINKFKPIIQGVWVKADYVNKVIKTKSPLAAVDEVNDITTMYINTDKIQKDSIIVPEGFGNHDGSTLILKFNPGKSKSSLMFGAGELEYSIENNDTLLTYSRFDKEKKQFTKTKFIRIFKREPNNDLADGMYYYINRFLIAGNYTIKDSTGESSKVHFSEDGKIGGFLNYKTYTINIDLNSDVNDNLDGIYFKDSNKRNRNYSFKIIADTIKLYDTRENADSTELILGELKYKLVRQK